MHKISQEVFERFQARKTKKQKQAFRDFITKKLIEEKIPHRIETSNGLVQSNNIVVGNIDTAKFVVGAHYDTAGAMPVANMILPFSIFKTLLVQLPVAVIAILVSQAGIFVLETYLWEFIYNLNANIALETLLVIGAMVVYFMIVFGGLLFIVMGVTNHHTANDNTSGTIAVLELILSQKINLNEVCFVLFDNEEVGLFGSRAFNKAHKKKLDLIPVLNLDCISDGKYYYAYLSKSIDKNEELKDKLMNVFTAPADKEVIITSKGMNPSDNMSFKNSIGFMTLTDTKLGRGLGKIHTTKDVVFQTENIEYYVNKIIEFSQA